MLPPGAAQAREIVHAGIAWLGYAVAVIGAGATIVSALLMTFGVHVSAIEVEAKAALAGSAIVLFSKLIDSGHSAVVGAATAKASAPAPTQDQITLAVSTALGQAFAPKV